MLKITNEGEQPAICKIGGKSYPLPLAAAPGDSPPGVLLPGDWSQHITKDQKFKMRIAAAGGGPMRLKFTNPTDACEILLLWRSGDGFVRRRRISRLGDLKMLFNPSHRVRILEVHALSRGHANPE